MSFALKLIREARTKIKKGKFQEALKKLAEADQYWPKNEEIKKLYERIGEQQRQIERLNRRLEHEKKQKHFFTCLEIIEELKEKNMSVDKSVEDEVTQAVRRANACYQKSLNAGVKSDKVEWLFKSLEISRDFKRAKENLPEPVKALKIINLENSRFRIEYNEKDEPFKAEVLIYQSRKSQPLKTGEIIKRSEIDAIDGLIPVESQDKNGEIEGKDANKIYIYPVTFYHMNNNSGEGLGMVGKEHTIELEPGRRIQYKFKVRKNWFTGRILSFRILFKTDKPCRLNDLILVRNDQARVPLSKEDGECVYERESIDLKAGLNRLEVEDASFLGENYYGALFFKNEENYDIYIMQNTGPELF